MADDEPALAQYLHGRLAALWPEAALLPSDDPEAEAQVVSWMSFIAATLHPARRRGPDAAHAAWALAEQRLGGRDWAVDRYSIADIHLFRLFWRLVGSHTPDRAAFPGLYAHYERMMARAAVQRTIADEMAMGYELPA